MQFQKMEKLPDANSFNGTLDVWVAVNDIKSYVLLSEAEDHTGPDLVFGLAYYAPAVAARLGLKQSNCLFLLHEVRENNHGITDNVFCTAHVTGLEDDGYGRYRAAAVNIKNMPLGIAQNLEDYLGSNLSKNQGKTGLFENKGQSFHARIDAYDGFNYYTEEEGEFLKIQGNLIQILTDGDKDDEH